MLFLVVKNLKFKIYLYYFIYLFDFVGIVSLISDNNLRSEWAWSLLIKKMGLIIVLGLNLLIDSLYSIICGKA